MATQYMQHTTVAPNTSPVPSGATTPRVLTPATLEWQLDAFDPRRAAALILGDPAKPGPYAVRYRVPAGYELGTHVHSSEDEELTVISGAIRWSRAEPGGDPQGQVLPAGSFVMTPAGMPHRIAAVEDSILQLTGIGPRTYIYPNAVDDPRRKR